MAESSCPRCGYEWSPGFWRRCVRDDGRCPLCGERVRPARWQRPIRLVLFAVVIAWAAMFLVVTAAWLWLLATGGGVTPPTGLSGE